MPKIGRNSPCPCGSGRKYKRCCGDPLKAQRKKHSDARSLSRDLTRVIKRQEAEELIRKQQQGLGRPIISESVGEYRIVAVGDTVHYSPSWKYFPDFLSDYLKGLLGDDWGNAELAKPYEQRHPVIQWYDYYCKYQAQQERQADGSFTATAVGVVYCYLGLAYNLYLLKHNVELQARLVARVKDPKQFQGAYYESIVANCLIRAGFQLTLEDEFDPASKHCEFSAVSELTGKSFWVEAKMRSVSGLLGKTNRDGAPPTAKPTSKITDHLREALKKPAADDRLIFIDVNAPADPHTEEEKFPRWVKAAIGILDKREKDLKAGERAYLFLTNIPFHRNLDSEIRNHSALAHGLGMSDFGKPGLYRLTDIWKNKQAHIDAHNVLESLHTYPHIPNTFDGSLPLSKSSAANRILIGETYFFEGYGQWGELGEVTSALISESQKKLIIGIKTASGEGKILSRDVTEDEIAAYKAHPEGYFGTVQARQRSELRGPYDLFEWLVESYRGASREKLIEFCKSYPDLPELSTLADEDLLLVVCERWTAAIVARSRETQIGADGEVDQE